MVRTGFVQVMEILESPGIFSLAKQTKTTKKGLYFTVKYLTLFFGRLRITTLSQD